jgi:hypothetical protein
MLALVIAELGFWAWEPPAISDLPAYSMAIEVIDTVISAVALYWLFTGPGRAWFRRRSA